MKALLDTCVLSEIRRPNGHPRVKEAVSELADEDLFVSVLTLGEIAKGVALLAAGRKKKALTSWLNGLTTQFGDQVLTIDSETARLWGELTARAQNAGHIIPAVDGLLTATARRHGLHVMTHNTRHFEATGALVLDPWDNP